MLIPWITSNIFFFPFLTIPRPAGAAALKIPSKEELKIDKERYLELRKGILKDYHIRNYLLSAVHSMGSGKKFFLAEYPFCDYPYAVWEGITFFDHIRRRMFKSLAEAMEDIDSRMLAARTKAASRYSHKALPEDNIHIKIIPGCDPYE